MMLSRIHVEACVLEIVLITESMKIRRLTSFQHTLFDMLFSVPGDSLTVA